jgi:hypothetical protein
MKTLLENLNCLLELLQGTKVGSNKFNYRIYANSDQKPQYVPAYSSKQAVTLAGIRLKGKGLGTKFDKIEQQMKDSSGKEDWKRIEPPKSDWWK